MNTIFKRGTYTWWQVGLLKLSLFVIGAAIGANWPEVFLPYTNLLIMLGVALGLYLLYIWIRE